MTHFNIERSKRTPETEIDVILTNLSVLYDELEQSGDKHSFIDTYFKEMYENPNTSGDTLSKLVSSINPVNADGIGKTTEIAALVVSCAYCCGAQRAYDDGRINEAWTLIIDARDWLRVPMSRHPGIDRLKVEEHKKEVSRIRREARKKGADKYDYSEFALNMYRRRRWKNKAQAVEKISAALCRHIEKNNLPVRTVKYKSERGEIIEEPQTDFSKYVYNLLPTAKQVKIDSGTP